METGTAVAVEPAADLANAVVDVSGDDGDGEESAGDMFAEILGEKPASKPKAKAAPVIPVDSVEADADADVEAVADEPSVTSREKYEFESADGTKKKMTLTEAQKAWKTSGQFQQDYTKKTMEIANERKQLSRELVQLKAEQSKTANTASSIREWISEVSGQSTDPYHAMRLLEEGGIPMRRIIGNIVNDMERERTMPDSERQRILQERHARTQRRMEQGEAQKLQQLRETRQSEERDYQRTQTRAKADAWAGKAMKEAQLEGRDVDRDRLNVKLRAVLAAEKRPLMYDDFVDAAKSVREDLFAELRGRRPEEIIDGMDEETARKYSLALAAKLRGGSKGPPTTSTGNGSPAPRVSQQKTGKPVPRSFADKMRDGY